MRNRSVDDRCWLMAPKAVTTKSRLDAEPLAARNAEIRSAAHATWGCDGELMLPTNTKPAESVTSARPLCQLARIARLCNGLIPYLKETVLGHNREAFR